jgi:Rod binding domain-containing protein
MNSLPPSIATLPPTLSTPATPSSRGAKAAREFEASLIAEVLDQMQKTFSSLPGENTVPGADNYNYLGNKTLAEALAAHGGFGIAKRSGLEEIVTKEK